MRKERRLNVIGLTLLQLSMTMLRFILL